jgi:hypothetical protein
MRRKRLMERVFFTLDEIPFDQAYDGQSRNQGTTRNALITMVCQEVTGWFPYSLLSADAMGYSGIAHDDPTLGLTEVP